MKRGERSSIERAGLDDTTTVASTARAGMIAADADRLAVKP